MSAPRVDSLIAELDAAAKRLRAGGLEAAEAAALVQRCADLAGRLTGELEELARSSAAAGTEDPRPGQEELL